LAGLLSKLSAKDLYTLVKPRYKEALIRIVDLISDNEDAPVALAKLLKKVISINDMIAEAFIADKGVEFLQSAVIKHWDPYGYKVVAALCVRERFIDEVMKTNIVKDLISKINRGREEEKKNSNEEIKPQEDEKEEKKAKKKHKKEKPKKQEEEKKSGEIFGKPPVVPFEVYLKTCDKILSKASTSQIQKMVQLGILDALTKYLVPNEPSLDLVYNSITSILKAARDYRGDGQDTISEKVESLGLRRKILQCSGIQQPAADPMPFHNMGFPFMFQ